MTKVTVNELDKRLAVAEQNLADLRKLEDVMNRRFDKIEAKLSNGLSEEIKANSRFRKMALKILGFVGTPVAGALGYLMWRLLINLDKILKLVESAN